LEERTTSRSLIAQQHISIIIHSSDTPAHPPEIGTSATFREHFYNAISARLS
jgi:hypothetical protein